MEKQIKHNQFKYAYNHLYCMAKYWDKKMFVDSLQVYLRKLGIEVDGRKCKKDWIEAELAYQRRHPKEYK